MRTLAFLTSFYDLNGTLDIRKDFFKKLSKNFKSIYIINSDELNYFPKFEKKYYRKYKKTLLQRSMERTKTATQFS